MALPVETVVKQLTDSGIIAPDKLEEFVPPKAHPTSVDVLVAELVKHGQLTPFQAAQVKAGKVRALILGSYTILDRIGAGGMGQVFKAQHRRMKRVVAIKMLPNALTKDATALARFEREVEAAAKLLHPNIVSAFDADQANGIHFLVMEYVEGKDLSALVRKDGPLPVNKAVSYILQAARGLEFAHSKGVIHRDIKPANLLLSTDGTVKILDMGLARIESDGPAQTELTGTGAIMGTVDYMAPEQALNTKYADQRADIYSLGISLHYLLAGRAAYGGESPMEKLMAHQTQPIPSLQDVQATVPKGLDAIFRKMVAKKIEDRYQSMSEVIEALEDLGIGGSATVKKGEIARTVELSPEQKKKLAATAKKKPVKKPVSSLTDKVASEKTKYLVAKIVSGAFATIIAPILVTYLIRYLEKKDEPQKPPAVAAEAETVPPAVAAGTSQDASPSKLTGNHLSQPWESLAFQQWMKDVASFPAEKQIEAVSKKLLELNPGFDGKVAGADGNGTPKIENGVVTEFGFVTDNVSDVSPVRAFVGLKSLDCSGTRGGKGKLSDLSPLQGMNLTLLKCHNIQTSDLSPLRGMPLTILTVSYSAKMSNLSPLQGMSLSYLDCNGAAVTDLSPLKGMPLTSLLCVNTPVSNLLPLQECKSLKVLHVTNTKVTPAGVAALQKALPNCKIEWDAPSKAVAGQPTKPWNTPAFQAWVKEVQAMPAEEQVKAMSEKLVALNPGFDGKVTGYDGKGTPKIESGKVTEMGFFSESVTDVSPVRALVGLKKLTCAFTQVSDLSPLEGIKLAELVCYGTQVSDLSPVQGMPLTKADCGYTQISDLSPLEGTPLVSLRCDNTHVSNLLPLQGMKLTYLSLTPRNITKGLDVIRQMKSLKIIGIDGSEKNKLTPAEFWKKYDAGEFGRAAAFGTNAPGGKLSAVHGMSRTSWLRST